jgi:hypothetical protein
MFYRGIIFFARTTHVSLTIKTIRHTGDRLSLAAIITCHHHHHHHHRQSLPFILPFNSTFTGHKMTTYVNEKPEFFYGIRKVLPPFFHILFYSHFTFPPRDFSFILMLLSHSLKVVEDPVCLLCASTGCFL